MKKIKRVLRVLVFIAMMLLAMAGVGLPIPMFYGDRFAEKKDHQEQIDEREEDLEN